MNQTPIKIIKRCIIRCVVLLGELIMLIFRVDSVCVASAGWYHTFHSWLIANPSIGLLNRDIKAAALHKPSALLITRDMGFPNETLGDGLRSGRFQNRSPNGIVGISRT